MLAMNDTFVYSSDLKSLNKSRSPLDCRDIGTAVWYLRVLVQGLLFAASALTNLLNLVVFHLWKRKETFLNFHIALSLSSLACALCGLILVMDTPFSSSSDLRLILGNASTRTLGAFNEYLLIIISIDRWISIEFRFFYHRCIGRRFVLTFITGTFLFVLIQNTIVYFVLSAHWVTSGLCGIRASNFVYGASWYRIYYGLFLTVTKYAVQIPTQARLCWMGIRLKRRKNQRVVDIRIILTRSQLSTGSPTMPNTINQTALETVEVANPRYPSSRTCLQLWRSYTTTVLAGSAIVINSLVCSLPILLTYSFGNSRPDYMHIVQYPFLIYQLRDISPFFIYVLFYPEYRHAFAGLCRTMGRHVKRVAKPVVAS